MPSSLFQCLATVSLLYFQFRQIDECFFYYILIERVEQIPILIKADNIAQNIHISYNLIKPFHVFQEFVVRSQMAFIKSDIIFKHPSLSHI